MNSLEVESADIIRLIQHHLTECGLHESCRILREESGIGASGTFANLRSLASSGRWGEVLSVLSNLDTRKNPINPHLIAEVHEMTILELAEVGEIEIAYAALRLLSTDQIGGRYSSIERRIQAIDSIRKQQQNQNITSTEVSSNGMKAILPLDYYGKDNVSRQRKRDDIGKQLADTIPIAPRGRLMTLLQQSIKWQAHTGQLPMMKRMSEDDIEKEKHKKSKRKTQSTFDLVLGETTAARNTSHISNQRIASIPPESIPSRITGKIKFGKKTQPLCALFFKDGSGFVTGSSDGFVEVWDTQKWGKLRSDLIYQQQEEFMLHDAPVLSLATSNDGEMLATGSSDGTFKVWNISNGRCLRMFTNAHGKAISALAFSRDGTHVLSASHDCLCREFGLRASRMLKQFQGHTSYVNTCAYVYDTDVTSSNIFVVTASADATVRIWDGKTSEVKHIIRPFQSDPSHSIGTVIGESEDTGIGMNVHSVLHLHHPEKTMIVVGRSSKAYLMNYSGSILKTYERTKEGHGFDFVGATMSPSNKWLYITTEDHLCLCFDVSSGSVENSMVMDETNEMTGLAHHPHLGLLAMFHSSKSSSGILKIWK